MYLVLEISSFTFSSLGQWISQFLSNIIDTYTSGIFINNNHLFTNDVPLFFMYPFPLLLESLCNLWNHADFLLIGGLNLKLFYTTLFNIYVFIYSLSLQKECYGQVNETKLLGRWMQKGSYIEQ